MKNASTKPLDSKDLAEGSPVSGKQRGLKCYSGSGGVVTGEFRSEQELVDVLLELLSSEASPWLLSKMKTEFEYTNGRTDVIGLLGSDIGNYASSSR